MAKIINPEEINRICDICKDIITYSTKWKKRRADENNAVCRLCSNKKRKGDNHPMYGKPSPFKDKKHTKESKELISKNHTDISGENNPMYGKQSAMYGKHHTELSKYKISTKNKGRSLSKESKEKIRNSKLEYYKTNDGINKGKKFSNESKLKMRLSAIERISRDKFNGFQFYPTYNKKSIKELISYGISNNLNLKHAENGGEFYIKELGYWVDGYDIDKNVVVEFYEKYHKYTIERDINRKNEIMNFLKCCFVIIHENESIEKYEYIQ